MQTYKSNQDSYFLANFLQNYLSQLSQSKKANLTYLDMGCGSGILSKQAIKSGIARKNITAVDINPEAVRQTKKLEIQTLKSDLFSNPKLKNKKFDIITFNPPYLPAHKFDKQKDTTGGKHGDETAVKFLKQARKHLNKNGKIFLLTSSITPQNKIKKFNLKFIATKKLFFEKLYILEFSFS